MNKLTWYVVQNELQDKLACHRPAKLEEIVRTCYVCAIGTVNRVERIVLRGAHGAGVSSVRDAIAGGHVRPVGVVRAVDGWCG